MSTAGNWRGPNIVKDGLVLYLDAGSPNSYINGISGTLWKDISGNANNGTLTNGPTYSPDNGGIIQFDGVNDYAILPPSISNTITTSFTMMCFLYIETTTLFGSILGYNNPGSAGQLFALQVRSNSNVSPANITLVMYTNVVNVFGASTNVNFFEWHHVAATYDGVNTKMYLDGVLSSQTNTTGSFSPSAFNLFIGSDFVRGRYSKNKFGPTLIYNRALSTSEISQNFNATRARFGI